LQELEKSLEIAEKEASDVKEKKEEHGRLAEFIVLLNEIRGVFDKSGLQLELRKRAVPAIESHVREFFREFNFEYSDISLTQDYDISLHGPGGETTTGMMSGGEKIAAALALRLGIARTLAGPSAETVMLDEPTIFLDEQRRQDLIEVLRKMSVMPQMIVVTHDLAMEDAADSIVIVKKEKGVSCVGG
jgi:exonuclease SbcC